MQMLKLLNKNKNVIINVLNVEDGFYFSNVGKISSNLLCVSYDNVNNLLRITFKSNPKITYRYKNVNVETYAGLLFSESLGKYFCKNIKNKFEFEKEILGE